MSITCNHCGYNGNAEDAVYCDSCGFELNTSSNTLPPEAPTVIQQPNTTEIYSDDGFGNREITLIGDRIAGKTTYLASLIRNPNARKSALIQSIQFCNEYAERLFQEATNILEQGDIFPATWYCHLDEYPIYQIQIQIKKKELLFRESITSIFCNCREYAGEFFDQLQNQKQKAWIQRHIEGLYEQQIMLLIDGINSSDDLYSQSLEILLTELHKFKLNKNIAAVFTKCDYPELYINRHHPEDIAWIRFPKTYRILDIWQGKGLGKVEYFCTSAFGMIKTKSYIEQNCVNINDYNGGIKEPKLWKPFGLVSPLYWLSTGKKYSALDDE